jgi:hypothetical protein
MCDSMSKGIETVIENYKPKERFNLYKISWVNQNYYLEDR